ncbi:SH3 domain-containing protein [Mesorhizobium sp. B2-5-13]|uniref:SH3 domain-containing protein n=1 Tax=unclassified Mesorhizobium TaxID=325217 RepID=UPI0011274059|nr:MULTISPECIES: SH3 domain-containing protein [unclassified Mesorhizobium]TPJ41534.1 SH3 domain-containing protein [Mesorhizobium sp. B2-6-5]TPJ84649.1 SH3 domain-containing protein [Mesorhizobium sp. B2-5-13]TPK50795.1 SH3 domain-containing protein [Mesorhizobium sp. B2-5-5]
MREPFSFGAPERRRFAMQFGYDMRPSFWQGVRSNSHLVIAAVGTAALLGVAAVALWLALPTSERQAVASPEQSIPSIPVKTTKVSPSGTTVTAAAVTPRVERKSSQVPPTMVAAAGNIQALAANDPRWTGAQQKAAAAAADPDQTAAPSQVAKQPEPTPAKTAAAFAQSSTDTDATDELAKVAAPSPPANSSNPDGAQTAAIPETQPQVADQKPANAQDEDNAAKAKPRKVAAAGSGRILRTVTMRSAPKKGATPIGSVPARTSVQLIGCKKWCEIVYNGKHGWVYKSYVKPGA